MPWGAQPQPDADQDRKGAGEELAEGLLMAGIGLALLPIAVIAVIGAVLYRRAGPRAWIYWALAVVTAGIGLAILGWPAWVLDYERGYGVLSGHAIDVLLWLPMSVPAGLVGGLALGRIWRYLAKRSRHSWPVLAPPEGWHQWFQRDTSPAYRKDKNLPWDGRGLRPGVLDGPNKAAEKVAADAPLPGRFTLGYALLPANRADRGHPPRRLINAEYHLLVVAQPGAGKTYSLVIPNVLEWCGTLIVTTNKLTRDDILANTYDVRSRMGGGAWVFDPSGQSGYEFPGWNPLKRAKESWDAARKVAQAFAAGAGRGAEDRDSTGRFFAITATNMLAPYIRAAALADKSMIDILRWIQASGKAAEAARAEVRGILEAQGPGMEGDALGGLSGAEAGSPDSIGDTHQTVITLLSTWQSERVRQLTSDSSWDIEEFIESHGTLYLLSLESSEEFRPLFTMFVSELFSAGERVARKHGGILDPPVSFLLDEAANIAPIPDLAQRLSTTREWARIMTVWQARSQLITTYGEHAAETIEGSSGDKLCFRPGQDRTAEWAATALGTEDYAQESWTPARHLWEVAGQPTKTPMTRPRATANQIMGLADYHAICFPNSRKDAHEILLRGWAQDSGIVRHIRVVLGEDDGDVDPDYSPLPDAGPDAAAGDGTGRMASVAVEGDSTEWPIDGLVRNNGHHPDPDEELAEAMAEDEEDQELDLDLPMAMERMEDRELEERKVATRMARSR